VVYPRRGMFVSPVDIGDLAGLSEVRTTFESHAARLAAERATDAERAETNLLLAELDESSTNASTDMSTAARTTRFSKATLNEYYMLTLRIWLLVLDRVVRLGDAIQEHRELLEAIRDRDRARAEDVMRRHVEGFEQAIRRVL